MEIATIYRSDYNGNKDSEGTSYFDYLLSALNIDKSLWNDIDEVELHVVKAKINGIDQEIYQSGRTRI
uniref:Uncharacterized protein n=1 Tax=viral metagenome TaxID=1070528 RepID=A0A6M3L389_9ZZZZ